MTDSYNDVRHAGNRGHVFDAKSLLGVKRIGTEKGLLNAGGGLYDQFTIEKLTARCWRDTGGGSGADVCVGKRCLLTGRYHCHRYSWLGHNRDLKEIIGAR